MTIHAFLLIIMMGEQPVSRDMFFYDVERCNFFASELVKTFGKANTDQMRTAYCKPVRVDPDRNTVYR